MARNRRRRGRGSARQFEIAERGEGQCAKGGEGDGGTEGASGGRPPEVVVPEADGNGVGGVADTGRRDMAKAGKGDGHRGADAEGGRGGNAGLPRPVATAAAHGHAGANGEDGGDSRETSGKLRTVVSTVESSGAGVLDGDEVFKAHQEGCLIVEAILNWSVKDVTSPDLLKGKVKQLPSEFSSLQSYSEMQCIFLMEEIRATLHSKLMDTATPQCYCPLSISSAGVRSVYFVDMDLEAYVDCSHVVQDGDVLLFTENVDDTLGCFGIATGVGQDITFQKSFRVLVSKDNKDCNLRKVRKVRFVSNVMEAILTSKSIRLIQLRDWGIMKSIMKQDKKSKRKCIDCAEIKAEEFTYSEKFNKEQIDAVKLSVSKARCQHKNSIGLVWGAPGSGKTEVAISIVHSLVQLRRRVLVCVPKSKDILVFVQKYKELYPSFDPQNILIISDCNSVNNTENEICKNFSDITLEHRAQELYCSIYLWRSWVKQILVLLDLQPYCLHGCKHDGELKCSKKKFCFKMFQEKVSSVVLDVRECSQCLMNSSGIYLSENNITDVNKLLDEIGALVHLLLHPQGHEFEAGFPFTSDEATSVATQINAARLTCIQSINVLIKSIVLPHLEARKDWEDFSIAHTGIILCTPASSSRLHGMSDLIDVLLVDDAAQLRESELLIPLSLPPSHVVLLGDHFHLQPMVNSQMCKDLGYNGSLLERLLHLTFESQNLNKQYMMDPAISQFPNEHFYGKKILNAQNISPHDHNNMLKEFSSCHFFDTSHVEELRHKGKAMVESAEMLFLLQRLCSGLRNYKGRVNVGIICLCSSRVNKIISHLGTEYKHHEKINVEVCSIGNVDNTWYDVVILSLFVEDTHKLPAGNWINVALTRSKHRLWMIGEIDSFVYAPGKWPLLIKNVRQRRCLFRIDSMVLSKHMKQLEKTGQSVPIPVHSSVPNKVMHLPARERTWLGRPINMKYILDSLRDQKGDADTCTLQASLGAFVSSYKLKNARRNPPRNFLWEFAVKSLKTQYEIYTESKLGSEDRKKGERTDWKEKLFKSKLYDKVDLKYPGNVTTRIKRGKIMVCYFLLSRNYFYLKPGEPYRYDATQPFLHPKSLKLASHAVMAIRDGKRMMPPVEETSETNVRRHVVIQNSEGKRFGIEGFGKVMSDSVEGMYEMKV